jgi:carbon-monoxide dehydrogenase small subunit
MDELLNQSVEVMVNGHKQTATVESRQLLVHFLRTDCGLTGTHVGCDTSYCGACTVQLDGAPVKSCSVLTVQANGRQVKTVEGLETPTGLHVLQKCFSEHHALQCGYCTPGMLMAASSLLELGTDIDEDDVRKGLAGNVCRCTGYQNIIAAVMDASRQLGRSRS